MRQIGHLENEAAAKTFGDFLYVQGIQNQLEHEPNDGWTVWIHDEEHLTRAKELLAEFRAAPNDTKYFSHKEQADKLRSAEQKSQVDYEKRLKSRRHLFRPMTAYGFGPLTFVLIAISVIVFIKMNLGDDGNELERVHSLFIKDFFTLGAFQSKDLPEVRSGEIWRLLTPIFIHFNFLHIVFNMIWLRDLGSMIEGRQSSFMLALLVVAIGVCSNLGEFLVMQPVFGGMSGVVYGLLGYIWIRGKFDPGSGLFLHPSTVWMMIVWFFLCWSGLMGHIANVAHTVGLFMGVAWGWLSAQRHR